MTNKIATSKAVSVVLFGALVFTACNSGSSVSSAPERASTPTETPSIPEVSPSDWQISEPQVNSMDGAVTRFVSTSGFAHLCLCFKNGKPCSVPVWVQAPKHCFIESNVEGSNYSRRVRAKFDDEKPSTEIWSIVDSHDAIFPHGSQAFIAKLKKHSKFLIEFGCDASDSDVITIGIRGLQSSLDSIKQIGKEDK